MKRLAVRAAMAAIFHFVLSGATAAFAEDGARGPITVETTVETQGDLDEVGRTFDEVWLAALVTDLEAQPDGILVRLRKTQSGWFTFWGLEVAASKGVFPSHLVSGTDGNYDLILFPNIPYSSIRQGDFETVLSYDPHRARVSFSVVETGSHNELLSGSVLVPSDAFGGRALQPVAGRVLAGGARRESSEQGPALVSFTAEETYSEVGLFLSLQRALDWDLVSLADPADRARNEFFDDEPLAVVVDWPPTPVPGVVRLVQLGENERLELASASWTEGSSTIPLLPTGTLRFGMRQFELEYVEDGESRLIGHRVYTISPNRALIDFDVYGRNYRVPQDMFPADLGPDPGLFGVVRVSVARPIENATFSVEARYVPTRLENTAGGSAMRRLDSEAVVVPVFRETVDLRPDEPVEIPFSFEIPPYDGWVDFRVEWEPAGVQVSLRDTSMRVLRAPMVPAFPGAEGFGAYTPGGRGGRVYVVTNLNDSGPGSLREAVAATGPRIVVFAVSGVIELKSTLTIRNPYITIAGQTAPGDGITIAGYGTRVQTHDVVIQHLRFRPGDIAGREIDALNVDGASHVIVDHVSASWGIDESLSVVESDMVTVQWSIISETLNESVHSKGAHGRGSLVRGSRGARYTLHHNLWAHHEARLPASGNYENYIIDPVGLLVDIRNNVIYNWGSRATTSPDEEESITKLNIVNNAYKMGPDSQTDRPVRLLCPKCSAYVDGNTLDGVAPEDPWSLVLGDDSAPGKRQEEPFPFAPVATDLADVAFERVLEGAGAQPRDAVDARVVASVRERTGRIIDSQSEVGGWPVMQSDPARAVDSSGEGIPDWWQFVRGYDPKERLDPASDPDGDGYTLIEEYLHDASQRL